MYRETGRRLTAIKLVNAEKCAVDTRPGKPEPQMATAPLTSPQQTCASVTRGRKRGSSVSPVPCLFLALYSSRHTPKQERRDNWQSCLRVRKGDVGYRGKTRHHGYCRIPVHIKDLSKSHLPTKRHVGRARQPLLLSPVARSPGQTPWTYTSWCLWA